MSHVSTMCLTMNGLFRLPIALATCSRTFTLIKCYQVPRVRTFRPFSSTSSDDSVTTSGSTSDEGNVLITSPDDSGVDVQSTPLDQSILPQYAFADRRRKLEEQAGLLGKTVFPSFEPKSIMRRLERIPQKIDPWDTTIIYFPGEGNHYVGMGEKLSDYPNVLEMLKVAGRIMQTNLIDTCFNGPADKLAQVADEAVYVCSLAAAEKIRYERPQVIESCVGVAGSSIGEITAMVFTGALSFEDGLRLIQLRNKAIAEVNRNVPSGLINCVLGADAKVKLITSSASEYLIRLGLDKEEAICSIAYYLFAHCKILGGHQKALDFVRANAKDFGIRRIKNITKYGSNGVCAMHTAIMKPVEKVMRQAIVRMSLGVPKVPLYSGVDHKAYHSIESIVDKLPKTVSNPVHMEQIMNHLYYSPRDRHLPYSFEFGPGKSMTDLLERINSRARRQMTTIFA